MNKGLWLGVGIIVSILVVGGYLFLGKGSAPVKRQTASPPSAKTASESTPAVSPTLSGEVKNIVVEASEYSFKPKTLTFAKGDNVHLTFKNAGTLPHNYVIDELGISTKTVPPGETTTIDFTVNQSGTFTAFCSIGNHRSLGMEGSVEVK